MNNHIIDLFANLVLHPLQYEFSHSKLIHLCLSLQPKHINLSFSWDVIKNISDFAIMQRKLKKKNCDLLVKLRIPNQLILIV